MRLQQRQSWKASVTSHASRKEWKNRHCVHARCSLTRRPALARPPTLRATYAFGRSPSDRTPAAASRCQIPPPNPLNPYDDRRRAEDYFKLGAVSSWQSKYWFNYGITNDPARSPQSFRKTPLDEAHPPQSGAMLPMTYARTVGGSSVHFAGNYWRFHEVDFHERSQLGAIAGASLADWPRSAVPAPF